MSHRQVPSRMPRRMYYVCEAVRGIGRVEIRNYVGGRVDGGAGMGEKGVVNGVDRVVLIIQTRIYRHLGIPK